MLELDDPHSAMFVSIIYVQGLGKLSEEFRLIAIFSILGCLVLTSNILGVFLLAKPVPQLSITNVGPVAGDAEQTYELASKTRVVERDDGGEEDPSLIHQPNDWSQSSNHQAWSNESLSFFAMVKRLAADMR